MAKLTTADLGSLSNPTSAVTTINSNNALIETALENTLSRDGTAPNEMGADLDMNSNRILNLVRPDNPNEPARLADLLEVQTMQFPLEVATSETSVTIGTGSKSFVIQAGKAFYPNRLVLITEDEDPTVNWMSGIITAYDDVTGDLTVNVTVAEGSGTHEAWTLRLSGSVGATGPSGTSRASTVFTASTDNVDIASGLVNAATIGGAVVSTGQRVLLLGQTDPAENGLYIVAASGAASRDGDYDTYDAHPGAIVTVTNGDNGTNVYLGTSQPGGVLGTNDIEFTLISNAELVDIAAIVPANNDFIQRKTGNWVNRTIDEVKNDLAITDILSGVGSTITTSSAYTATSTKNLGSGSVVIFRPNATNVGVSTININGGGAINIQTTDGNNTSSGMLTAGQDYVLHNFGGVYRILGRPMTATLAVYSGASGTNLFILNKSLNLGTQGESFPRARLSMDDANELKVLVGDGTASAELVGQWFGSDKSYKAEGPIRDSDNQQIFSPQNYPPVTSVGMTGIEIRKLFTDSMFPNIADNVESTTLSTANAYVATFMDAGKFIIANHASAKIDFQHFPIGAAGVDIMTPAGCTVELFCGGETTDPTPSWFGQANTDKKLTFPENSLITVRRPLNSTFVAIQHAGAAPTAAATNPAARDISFITAGQSLAVRFIELAGIAGFQKYLADESIAKDIWAIQGAAGASALFPPTDGSQAGNFWVDSSDGTFNTGTFIPGPCLTAFMAAVDKAVALGQPEPQFVIEDLGQTDALHIQENSVVDGGEIDPSVAKYQEGREWLIDYVRANLPTPNATLPWLIVPLNGDDSTGPATAEQYSAVRAVQMDIINTKSDVHMGPNVYDLTYPAFDLHTDVPGTFKEGLRLGAIYDNLFEAGTAYEGPEIVDVIKFSDTRYDVIIDKQTGGPSIDAPEPVEGFAFIPSAATSMLTATPEIPYSQTYGTAAAPYDTPAGQYTRLTLLLRTGEAGTMKLMYPYGHADDIMNTRRVIRRTAGTVNQPLKPYWEGF